MEPEKDTTPPAPENGRKYHVDYIPWGVTSFEDLDALTIAQETTEEVREISWQYMAMLENILFPSDAIDNIPARIRALSLEFARRMERVLAGEVIEPKSYLADSAKEALKSANFAVQKDLQGNWRWYGKPTNNFLDRDEEILTEDGHKWFVQWVNEHPEDMPALWLWHEEKTACQYRADWVAWADNALHLSGVLTEAEAQMFLELSKAWDLAMSHGFQVLGRKENLITRYLMFEASVLPREYAANTFTAFTVMEESKMFSGDERKFLVQALGEDRVRQIETDNEKAASHLRESVEHKEATPPDTRLDALTAKVDSILAHLAATTPPAEDQPQDEAGKSAPAPQMSKVAENLAKLDPTQADPLPKDDPLGKAKPKTTRTPKKGLLAVAEFLESPETFKEEDN